MRSCVQLLLNLSGAARLETAAEAGAETIPGLGVQEPACEGAAGEEVRGGADHADEELRQRPLLHDRQPKEAG